MSLGDSCHPLPPTVGSTVFKTVCAPKLMYGLESCVLDNVCISEIEKTQRHCAKVIQGMPMHMPNPVPEVTLGWLSAESNVNINKMVFLYHWLTLPINCIYKQVVILRLVTFIYGDAKKAYNGPLFQAYCIMKKYGLEQNVLEVLENGNTMSVKEFRGLVRRVVAEKENSQWKATVFLYRSLKLFRECFPKNGVNVWWSVAHFRPRLCKAAQSMLKLICGQYKMHGAQGQAANLSGRCAICGDFEADDVPHLLFTCHHFLTLRDPLWGNVISTMPEPMVQHVIGLNAKDRTIFLLSGFHVSFTSEWIDIYGAVAVFAHRLYEAKVHGGIKLIVCN